MTRARARHARRRRACSPASTPLTPGTPARTCCWPPGPAASPCSPRSLSRLPRKPAPAATPRTCLPSTGTPSRSPAPRARSAANGPPSAPAAATDSPWRFPPLPAGPARSAASAPPRSFIRHLFLRPREIHEAVTALRASQTAQEWKNRYAIRAGVEGTIRQATAVTGIRTARYRGLPKTTLEHATAAAAINLISLDAWHTSEPLDRTRTTHLQRLTLQPPSEPNKPTESKVRRKRTKHPPRRGLSSERRSGPTRRAEVRRDGHCE